MGLVTTRQAAQSIDLTELPNKAGTFGPTKTAPFDGHGHRPRVLLDLVWGDDDDDDDDDDDGCFVFF